MNITKPEFAREGVLGPDDLAACKFLVIDDSRMIRLTIIKHLHQLGFESIDEADNGAAAIELLRTGKDYDLVLLDLEMPGMNGFEVLSALRNEATFRHLLVVMLTTSTRQEDIDQAYELIASSYLVKQSDFRGFLEQIDSLVRFWTQVRFRQQANVMI